MIQMYSFFRRRSYCHTVLLKSVFERKKSDIELRTYIWTAISSNFKVLLLLTGSSSSHFMSGSMSLKTQNDLAEDLLLGFSCKNQKRKGKKKRKVKIKRKS